MDFQEQIYGLFEVNQQLEKEKAEKEQRLSRLRHANNTDRLTEIQVSFMRASKKVTDIFLVSILSEFNKTNNDCKKVYNALSQNHQIDMHALSRLRLVRSQPDQCSLLCVQSSIQELEGLVPGSGNSCRSLIQDEY